MNDDLKCRVLSIVFHHWILPCRHVMKKRQKQDIASQLQKWMYKRQVQQKLCYWADHPFSFEGSQEKWMMTVERYAIRLQRQRIPFQVCEDCQSHVCVVRRRWDGIYSLCLSKSCREQTLLIDLDDLF